MTVLLEVVTGIEDWAVVGGGRIITTEELSDQ